MDINDVDIFVIDSSFDESEELCFMEYIDLRITSEIIIFCNFSILKYV